MFIAIGALKSTRPNGAEYRQHFAPKGARPLVKVPLSINIASLTDALRTFEAWPCGSLLAIGYNQSVVGPLDSWREMNGIAFVLYIVCNVGQVRATRFDLLDIANCLVEPQMGGVLGKSKTVKYEHIQFLHCLQCRWWNLFYSCSVICSSLIR